MYVPSALAQADRRGVVAGLRAEPTDPTGLEAAGLVEKSIKGG